MPSIMRNQDQKMAFPVQKPQHKRNNERPRLESDGGFF
jgi:hypothetical protein